MAKAIKRFCWWKSEEKKEFMYCIDVYIYMWSTNELIRSKKRELMNADVVLQCIAQHELSHKNSIEENFIMEQPHALELPLRDNVFIHQRSTTDHWLLFRLITFVRNAPQVLQMNLGFSWNSALRIVFTCMKYSFKMFNIQFQSEI